MLLVGKLLSKLNLCSVLVIRMNWGRRVLLGWSLDEEKFFAPNLAMMVSLEIHVR